ncbi:hypothetical protein TrVE_jg7784 [Triparma verrucosa]|uniref:GST N-terminal domain-containing protein n=1 Tax=Triparma verrucosa TaxID=1606542 RepID=A0A9W7BLW1_9STRA|nr:hypothetical protein TrVE_jg7784 [Triparma verrucosa]
MSTLPRFELRYFQLMARGLGPALVAEHSGLSWAGNKTLVFDTTDHWAALKPSTPFGQLPLLTVPGSNFQVAQTTAIISYIGRISGSESSATSDRSDLYALSQMLLAEAEDIYNLMVRFLPTPYKRLSSDGVLTSKGTAEDYDAFWATLLPTHLANLERLLPFTSPASGASHQKYLCGELHAFAMLYQAHLVRPSIFAGTPGLEGWFDALKTDRRTRSVLSGESPMGKLEQYFLEAGSARICELGDERGRWGWGDHLK